MIGRPDSNPSEPMKNVFAACSLAASALLCMGCELKPVQADSAADAPQRVYSTGSNIGRRPGAPGEPGTEVTTVGRDPAENSLNIRGTVPLSPGGAH
jgi:hypothetical protein